MKPHLEMVAFWRYDKFPFVLGGHVTNMNDNGSVELKEYGPGRYFKPIRLVPKAAGEKALGELETIRAEHDDAQRAFNKTWSEKLRDALPWIGKVE